jgi:predicted short-subunit dehydrogenase-like oxidoreductase (DUF2520 family)
MRLGIVGGGRAAWAFGSTWRRIGWPLAGVWLRDESHSHIAELLETARVDLPDLARDCELILLAVSDRAIDEVAAAIPETDALIFHASGALPAVRGGFSLHPLRALPAIGEPSDLADTLLVFEGGHRHTAKLVAAAAGARFAEVSTEKKPLYHAAAVFGSNYVAAMLEISQILLERSGVNDARGEIAALARSAIDNWRQHTDRQRFTGPAARGEKELLARHVEALRDDPQLAQLYELLAREIGGSFLARPK